MIKRKDGSYSQRGLWDNIRANKGSGKEPTKDMLKQESKIKKEENMKSMYKKGGKPSKKKVMKEAKKEGESFMVENKELSFGAPQMKKGGVKKYEDGGPGKMTAAEVKADMKSRASKPNPKAEMQNKVKADRQNKMTEAVKNKVRDDMNEDWRYNSWGADAYDAMSLGTGNFNYDVYDSKLPEVAKKAASKKTGGAKSMEPGGGGRFAKMVSGLKKEGKSEDSAKAIAASIGRKKYGKSKFQAMAAAGKKKMGGKKC